MGPLQQFCIAPYVGGRCIIEAMFSDDYPKGLHTTISLVTFFLAS